MTLQPADYIIKTQGQCILYTWGYYDENDDYYADWSIILGQQWLNNHFLTYDIKANTLTIQDAGVIEDDERDINATINDGK